MKIIVIFLLAFNFLVPNIFCKDDLLSKFHQNGYKVKDVRIQLMSYDENYFNFYTTKVFKFNRTTTAHNATINLKVNLEDKVELLVQAYKFLGNQFRQFPVRYQVNLKKSVDANMGGSSNLKMCGNVTTFYFYKETIYHVCNFVIDEKRFPPLIPNGKYKLELSFLYSDREIAMHYMFLEIYTPIEYPKK